MPFHGVLMYYLCMLRVSIADMISLNVRTKKLKNSELPTALYQGMPEMAMALMATIPCGPFAVSIPGENGLRRGYSILNAAPPSADGFVVVYRRTLNGRYEAEFFGLRPSVLLLFHTRQDLWRKFMAERR